MITKFGMSEKLGTLAIGRSKDNPFLGRDYYEERDYSEDVARQIDEEVRNLVDRCYQRATDIITTHRKQLDDIVTALLDRETLDREEFLAVMGGNELPAIKDTYDSPAPVEAIKDLEVTPGQTAISQKLEPGTA
jgi:cell division protease FtsH